MWYIFGPKNFFFSKFLSFWFFYTRHPATTGIFIAPNFVKNAILGKKLFYLPSIRLLRFLRIFFVCKKPYFCSFLEKPFYFICILRHICCSLVLEKIKLTMSCNWQANVKKCTWRDHYFLSIFKYERKILNDFVVRADRIQDEISNQSVS